MTASTEIHPKRCPGTQIKVLLEIGNDPSRWDAPCTGIHKGHIFG